MKTFHLLPASELCPYIDRFWGWEGEPNEMVHLPLLLPGTGAELYFHYGEPFRYQIAGHDPVQAKPGHLFCIRKVPISLLPMRNVGFVAVRFKIGALRRFTNIPAKVLADSHFSFSELWGASGNALLRHFSYANDRQERLFLIQGFLARCLRQKSSDSLIEQALSVLYRQHSILTIKALAEKLHLGVRQLERRWLAYSGHTPRETCCLSRFQHAVRELTLNPAITMPRVALSHGYYDQAHFIHDFQSRTGFSPGQYLLAARNKTHFYNTSLRNTGIVRIPHHHL
ncbi:MAG: helix-turn-helix domain-containing protein [Betaproteobacteria bacterium]|nr:helix-turn-helix domain-containing protein [Betaproteobacteria bacterium]